MASSHGRNSLRRITFTFSRDAYIVDRISPYRHGWVCLEDFFSGFEFGLSRGCFTSFFCFFFFGGIEGKEKESDRGCENGTATTTTGRGGKYYYYDDDNDDADTNSLNDNVNVNVQ